MLRYLIIPLNPLNNNLFANILHLVLQILILMLILVHFFDNLNFILKELQITLSITQRLLFLDESIKQIIKTTTMSIKNCK